MATVAVQDAKIARRLSRRQGLFAPDLLKTALRQSFVMLRPDIQWKNPVMFVVEVGVVLSLVFTVALAAGYPSQAGLGYLIQLDIWLFLTVLFANFAEALAEARGKAQAEALRKTRQETPAVKLRSRDDAQLVLNLQGRIEDVRADKSTGASLLETTVSTALKEGDVVVVEAGQFIPGDGEIVAGVASVDESAITGESAPVVREAGGDRSGVTGGTRVLSDRIIVQITARAGKSFLDRMIALVEGASRQRTPNEIALSLVLSAFTLIFLIVCVALWPMARHTETYMGTGPGLGTDVPTLVALLVCLIPTTIGALLAAIGIAGMDRALRANIIAKSGKAVEVAGDVDTLLLDKTGTITMGNRRATQFLPLGDFAAAEVGHLATLSSAADQTPEGKSIVELYRRNVGSSVSSVPPGAKFVEFTAQTRMSGVDLPDGRVVRKGAADAVLKYVSSRSGSPPPGTQEQVDAVAARGATPLLVCEGNRVAGLVVLEDILKPGISERFERLRRMGLRTVMVTGDNPLTAKSIAEKAGVDDYIAQATPEAKLSYIRKEQHGGKLVAMMGDGTNDAPALAQADVGVAMNSGTQAAKEAGNMVDLDSDPTKLIEVVEIGKQLLMTRGALTTFSIANDLAKYFAIVPALFASTLPWLRAVDIMHLASARSAILSAVIFNAIIIPCLIPIALKGVTYRPVGADALLRRNLLIWGLGGVIIPFVGIKLIDIVIHAIGLA
jgi:K+-transporting ATPase ATPase B chain